MRMDKREAFRFFDNVNKLGELVGYQRDIMTIIQDTERLCIIERQLSQIAERERSLPMTERQKMWNVTRTDNLCKEAKLIAESYGCIFYRQAGPYGCQVCFAPSSKILEGAGHGRIDNNCSSHGIAFYK